MIRSSCLLALKRSSATTPTLKCISTTPAILRWKPTFKKLLVPFAISWAASSPRRQPLHRSVRFVWRSSLGARQRKRASRLSPSGRGTHRKLRKKRKEGTMSNPKKDVSVVLVHAAWADGSSWNKVTEELQRHGFQVVAAQIPLSSFSDDVAVLRKVLVRQEGPVVLAGHSYGGAVITAAAASNRSEEHTSEL